MQLLATITEASEIDPNHSELTTRKAARAVVTDDFGRIALLYVGKYSYHKLPGGGIDPGESIEHALHREIMEELGCKVEIIAELGYTEEHWEKYQELQHSYCYLAKVASAINPPNFTAEEIANGFEMTWANNIDAAIMLLQNDSPTNYSGRLINKRDLVFLQAGKKFLETWA